MRMRQRVLGKRYNILAKRKESDNWSEWTQVDDIELAKSHVENVRKSGFMAKLVNREEKEVLIEDGSEKIS